MLDPTYTFKHALTHQAAYDSLLPEQRRLVHARVVEAIERTYRNRLAEHVEQLAHHALRGGLHEKAVDYLRRAGQKAAARSALTAAQSWLEQALGILEALPESRSTLEQAFEIRLELRSVLAHLGEPRRMLERLREAETLAGRLNDDRRSGRVLAGVMQVQWMRGELDEACASGSRALAIAEALGDFDLRTVISTPLAGAHYFRCDYVRAVELATDNLAALPAERGPEVFVTVTPPSVNDLAWLILSLAELGRFGEAAASVIEAIRLAEATGHAHTVGFAHRAASTLHLVKGDWATARSLVERWFEVVRAGNVVLQRPTSIASSAWVLAHFGEVSGALDRLGEGEQAIEQQAASGLLVNRGPAYHALGRACLILGRLDEAQRLANRAVESSSSQPGFAAHALHLLGDIATHPDRLDVERGERHYRQALALAEPRGMRPLIAHCHLGLGKLYRRTGEETTACEHLATAVTMYHEMDMDSWRGQAEAALESFR